MTWTLERPPLSFWSRHAIAFIADFVVGLGAGGMGMSMRWRDDRAMVPSDGILTLPPVQLDRHLATALLLLTFFEDPKLHASAEGAQYLRFSGNIALPVHRLVVVSARPLKQYSRRSMGSKWSLTLRADSGDVGTMWGDWLTLAWIGSRAGWPEPPPHSL